MAKKKSRGKRATQTSAKVNKIEENIKVTAPEDNATGEAVVNVSSNKKTTTGAPAQESDNSQGSFIHYLQFIPIVLVLGYLPTLMRTITYRTYLEGYDWFASANAEQVDVFLKCKANFFVVIAGVMLFVMLIWAALYNAKVFLKLKKLPFVFIAGAIVCVIISGITAENKQLLLHGGFENFESIFVTLSYFVTMIYTYLLFSQSESIYDDFKFVYRASLPGYLYISIIGLFQIFGMDLFKTDFGKKLFASREYWTNLDAITVGEGEYATLHNIDYVSTFFGMWIFIFFVMFIISKSLPEKIFRGFLTILAIVNMFGAGSDGGRLGVLAGAFFFILLFLLGKKKVLIAPYIGVVVLAVIAILCIPTTRAKIEQKIGWVDSDPTSGYRIHHITPDSEKVAFDLDGREYTLSYEYSDDDILKVDFRDGNGNPIATTYNEYSDGTPQFYSCDPSAIAEGTLISEYHVFQGDDRDSIRGVILGKQGDKVTIVISNEVDDSGEYYYLNLYDKFVQTDGTEIEDARLFPSNLFTGRGNIWNRTVPLLKQCIFKGCGSGLFITIFPQGDYLRKMFYAQNYDVKPHNLYLQYWAEEGLLFLVLLLGFFVVYVVDTFRVVNGKYKGSSPASEKATKEMDDKIDYILKDGLTADHWLVIGVFAALMSFLVAGIAGDSMIVHSPIFWTFFGIGLATNKALKL